MATNELALHAVALQTGCVSWREMVRRIALGELAVGKAAPPLAAIGSQPPGALSVAQIKRAAALLDDNRLPDRSRAAPIAGGPWDDR